MTIRFARVAAAALVAAATFVIPSSPARADRNRAEQWHLRPLNVAAAHRLSTGAGVTVAVLDSGVDPHPDLRRNLLPGTDVVPGGTGDGRADLNGHGTGMAGLIAAHGRGGDDGALGIAPGAKILPIRIETPTATATGAQTAQAIRYALQHKADIINLSVSISPAPELSRSIQEAVAAGVIVIAAAGNRPQNVVPVFPAFIDGVVAIGATGPDGNRDKVSVIGEDLALLAPGVDLFSTGLGGRYRRGTGTSGATAIVSGAAALVLSRYPDLSGEEVVHRLTATATDKGAPGRDPEYGYGVLNLVEALTADVPPLEPSAAPTPSAGPSPTEAGPQPGADASGGGTAVGLITVGLAAAAAAVVGAVLFLRRRRRGSTG